MRRSNVWVCGIVLFAVILILGIGSSNAQQQPVKRTVGLAASLQGGQPQILVPIWLGDRFILAPAVSLQHIESTVTNLGLGAAARFYLYMARVAPYFGGQAFAIIGIPSGGGGNTTDLSIGVFFGGEFFLHQRFSIGLEAHGDLFIPDTGPYTFNTSTGVIANIYF